MSDFTLNGQPVMRGDVIEPYQGAITAEVEVDADTNPTGAQTLRLFSKTYACTVVADPSDPTLALSGDSGGWKRCRLVAGAGGLDKPIAPHEEAQGAVVSQLLTAILGAGGEAMATDIAPDLLVRVVPQWSWRAGTVGNTLSALAEYLGVVWRIRADGLVWIGVPAPTPATTPDYIIVDVAPEMGTAAWDLNDATASPDQIIDGLTLRQIIYSFDGSSLRAFVTFAPGPVNNLFALFGMWLKRVNLDYFRLAPGRVAAQSGTTAQVQPDDTNFPPFRNVGVRLGLPDCSIQLNPAANNRCGIAWEGAAPIGPVISGFGISQALKIKLGISATPFGTEPTILGRSYRTAQHQMNADLFTAFTLGATLQLSAAGAAMNSAGDPGTCPTFAAAQPFFALAGAALIAAAQAFDAVPGGAAKALFDFEIAAAAHNDFQTSIVEAG